MGSSTCCLDMDYLLVCIVSRQSRVSVPHLVKKNKKKLALTKFLIHLKQTVFAWRVKSGGTSFI